MGQYCKSRDFMASSNRQSSRREQNPQMMPSDMNIMCADFLSYCQICDNSMTDVLHIQYFCNWTKGRNTGLKTWLHCCIPTFSGDNNWLMAAVSRSLSLTQSIQLPECHPLSFESFVFVFLHHFGLRCFCLDVNRLLLSWCYEDVSCNVSGQILLCFSPLHFLHLFHHLLLPHSGSCRQSDLSPVLWVCEEKGDWQNQEMIEM